MANAWRKSSFSEKAREFSAPFPPRQTEEGGDWNFGQSGNGKNGERKGTAFPPQQVGLIKLKEG